MCRLKDILIFDHDTGIINFKYKKLSDLAVSPNYDNLRHLGKITRYWILYNNDVGCQRYWGKNYFGIKDSKGSNKVFGMTKAENQQMGKFDFTVGLLITSVIGVIGLTIVSKMFKSIMYVMVIGIGIKVLTSKNLK